MKKDSSEVIEDKAQDREDNRRQVPDEQGIIHAAERNTKEHQHQLEMKSTPAVPSKNIPKINLSVKFVGRYVPPPIPKARRRSTFQSINIPTSINKEDDELMDEILEDEADQFNGIGSIGGIKPQPFGNISEIAENVGATNDQEASATSSNVNRQDSQDTTALSICSLSRMTTIRRVFEEFKVDITKLRFADLYNMITDSRDFSQESLKQLWKGTFNPDLREGQTLTQRTQICVEDTYELIEDDNSCLVFDTNETQKDSEMTIWQVLQKLGLLETTELDEFLSMTIEVGLKVTGNEQEETKTSTQ